MKIRSMLLSLSVVVLFTSVSIASSAVQQSRERVIRRLPIEKNEPLGITSVRVNGQAVTSGNAFVADDEWMRNLVISLKSKSDKRIMFVNIYLLFTRPAGSKDQMAMFDLLSYGNGALQTRPPNAGEQLIGIAPGETVEIGFSPQKFVDLTRLLTCAGFPQSVEKVDMRLGSVIFEDDTMWYLGESLTRDPADPKTWNVVKPKQNHASKDSTKNSPKDSTKSLLPDDCRSHLAHGAL